MVEVLNTNLESKFDVLVKFTSHICNAKCNVNLALYNEIRSTIPNS